MFLKQVNIKTMAQGAEHILNEIYITRVQCKFGIFV